MSQHAVKKPGGAGYKLHNNCKILDPVRTVNSLTMFNYPASSGYQTRNPHGDDDQGRIQDFLKGGAWKIPKERGVWGGLPDNFENEMHSYAF